MTACADGKGIVVAIDGPSGAGKSTVARRLADRLDFLYIDTGAMYRTVALTLRESGVSLDDEAAVARVCSGLRITFGRCADTYRVFANGTDVTEAIRAPDVSLLTSKVSAIKVVRDVLLLEQRRMGCSGNVVLEGRDIGSVVFPDADVKFFLSASPEERGRRRFLELCERGEDVTLEQTIAEVIARDTRDEQRQHAPLRKADDALVIDSDGITVDEVLERMELLVREKLIRKNLLISC